MSQQRKLYNPALDDGVALKSEYFPEILVGYYAHHEQKASYQHFRTDQLKPSNVFANQRDITVLLPNAEAESRLKSHPLYDLLKAAIHCYNVRLKNHGSFQGASFSHLRFGKCLSHSRRVSFLNAVLPKEPHWTALCAEVEFRRGGFARLMKIVECYFNPSNKRGKPLHFNQAVAETLADPANAQRLFTPIFKRFDYQMADPAANKKRHKLPAIYYLWPRRIKAGLAAKTHMTALQHDAWCSADHALHNLAHLVFHHKMPPSYKDTPDLSSRIRRFHQWIYYTSQNPQNRKLLAYELLSLRMNNLGGLTNREAAVLKQKHYLSVRESKLLALHNLSKSLLNTAGLVPLKDVINHWASDSLRQGAPETNLDAVCLRRNPWIDALSRFWRRVTFQRAQEQIPTTLALIFMLGLNEKKTHSAKVTLLFNKYNGQRRAHPSRPTLAASSNHQRAWILNELKTSLTASNRNQTTEQVLDGWRSARFADGAPTHEEIISGSTDPLCLAFKGNSR